MARVCIHSSLATNQTVQGYASELSDFLNSRSVSGRIGRNGGFENNYSATKTGLLKCHIKIPGEGFWEVKRRQIDRKSNNYLVYARHWDCEDTFQIIAIVTPDAHEVINKLLPDLIRITENDFQELDEAQLKKFKFY